MSASPSATHTYKAKDGLYYETYQQMREANIRFNEARLREKGLDQASFAALQQPPLENRTATPSKRVVSSSSIEGSLPAGNSEKSTEVLVAVRRSNRVRKVPPRPFTPDDGAHGGEPGAEGTDSATWPSVVKRRRPVSTKIESAFMILTDEDRRALATMSSSSPAPSPDNTTEGSLDTTTGNNNSSSPVVLPPHPNQQLLAELGHYLATEENVSHQNLKSVLRQVEKLVNGLGVTYTRWGEDVVFGKGVLVDLTTDLGQLYQEAVAFEEKHGRDLGNGWLLRHPIKKLGNFQRYYLAKKTANSV